MVYSTNPKPIDFLPGTNSFCMSSLYRTYVLMSNKNASPVSLAYPLGLWLIYLVNCDGCAGQTHIATLCVAIPPKAFAPTVFRGNRIARVRNKKIPPQGDYGGNVYR
jgi:hypothetical protein